MTNSAETPQPLLGVSTSVLPHKARVQELLWYSPDVIELYNYPTDALPGLAEFAGQHGIRLGLHTPTPYDGAAPLRRFSPTGPDRAEAREALRLVEATVMWARRLDALYVVVHFPSPYPPFVDAGFADACRLFLDGVHRIAVEHDVAVLIENLSAHPLLRTPQHYREALATAPALGFCLDLGHAHLLEPLTGPDEYADVLASRVQSFHVYNTTKQRYPEHGHERVSPRQHRAAGFMEIGSLLPRLVGACSPATVVLEHASTDHNAPQADRCSRWVRELLGSWTRNR